MTDRPISISKYRIIEEVASNALGHVYRCKDISLSSHNHIVAVKLLRTPYLDLSPEHTSFLQEAQLLKKLQHPSILPILDVGIDKDLPYLVMPYAPNGSLSNRLNKQAPHPLPLHEALSILAHIGQALAYAHEKNVIHGDLEPANILFNTRDEALLSDFGITTLLDSRMNQGIAVGMPFYMPPEQFGGIISKEGDQYALGCIAYHLLTGRVPFMAPDFFALRVKHESETPIPPTQINILLSEAIEQAIFKAMAKQPADRYTSIAAFLAALGVPQIDSALIQATSQADTAPLPALLPITILDTASTPGEPNQILAVSLPAGEPSLSTTAPAPALQDTEDMGSVLSPVTILPLEIEGAHVDTHIPLITTGQRTHQFEEDAIDLAGISEDPPLGHKMSEYPARPYWQLESSDRPVSASFSTTAVEDLSNSTVRRNSNVHQPKKRGMRRGRRRSLLIVAMLALLLLLISGGVLAKLTLFNYPKSVVITKPTTTTATVTIAPLSWNDAYLISAVTGKPLASKQQVGARIISATTPTQSQTVQATGIGTIPATYATGTLDFINDSISPQTYPAGSVYTGIDGIQVKIRQTVTVPAGYPDKWYKHHWGWAPIAAYAINAGAGGNIQTDDIATDIQIGSYKDHNGTWPEVVHVHNEFAFTGGRDTQHYTVVQTGDMNNAISNAQAFDPLLTQNAQSSLQKQTRSNEVPLGPARCTPTIYTDQMAGDPAFTVTATIMVTCSVEVYDRQAAYNMANNLLLQTNGLTQTLSGITPKVIQAKVVDSKGTLALLIRVTSPIYQFTDAQILAFSILIAGKKEPEALTLLLKQTGISQVSIKITGGDGQTLPTDPHQITINVSS